MKISRTSQLTGVARTLDIDVTDEELRLWKSGVLIQDAMPHLSSDDREFLMTGITSDEWDQAFPPSEDDPCDDQFPDIGN